MNTNELRIGNWVSEKVLGCRQVVTVDPLYFGINTGQGIYSIEHNNLEPIPLTEEWLLKFGFEKVNNELTNIAPLNLPCTFNLPNTPFSFCQGKLILTTSTGDFCVNTEYVHQLQNLYFALVGEELKIKEDESKTD